MAAVTVGAAALSLVAIPLACQFGVDVNHARFQCHTNADCGGGYHCVSEAPKPYGICFPVGQCDPSQIGLPCGSDGGCILGLTACFSATVICVAQPPDCTNIACRSLTCDTATPSLLNCGTIFPDAGPSDAGVADASVDAGPADGGPLDAGAPDAGTTDAGALDAGADAAFADAGTDGGVDAGGQDAGVTCVDSGSLVGTPACVPRETICDDCIDNDGDGLTDCADPDCDGRTCAPGKICVNFDCQ